MSGNDFAAVHRRHPDIPQDALPLDLPEPVEARGIETGKAKPKAVGREVCPTCAGERVVPLDRRGDDLVYRTHYRAAARGSAALLCPMSGKPYTGEETTR